MNKKIKADRLATQHWNKQDKKKPWLLYTLIATICFAIAWVMS